MAEAYHGTWAPYWQPQPWQQEAWQKPWQKPWQESWQEPWQKPWQKPRTQLPTTENVETADDGLTVLALTTLLQQSYGGRGPASCVGFLYQQGGGPAHKKAIYAHGGVSGFVKAHSNVFKLIPPEQGERCPSIGLLDAEERRKVMLLEAARESAKARKGLALCKFHANGLCTRGESCSFSHDTPQSRPPPPQRRPSNDGSDDEAGARSSQLRSQVLYYLSDENMRRDAFFQGIVATSQGSWIPLASIIGCPKMVQMEATVEDVLEALRLDAAASEPWLELREEPRGREAVRRTESPPPLEDERRELPPCPDPPEPQLSERPLELLNDRGSGWEALVEDAPRRSFMFFRQSSWDAALLQEEMRRIEATTQWHGLRSKNGNITRNTAWIVSDGCCCRYTYGDVSVEAQQRPEWLDDIEERVLREGCSLERHEWPNALNINFYETEDQNVGWHSDDEGLFRGTHQDCRIISASWGETRKFEIALKDKQNPLTGKPGIFRESLKSVQLKPGDLITMNGLFQKYYSHQLAKGAGAFQQPPPAHKRINLTWRYIVQHKPYCPMHKTRYS